MPVTTKKRPQPFLKWAGGKRQLLPQIRKYVPHTFHTYYEPFVGAGAVLFDLRPKKAVINDINPELVNTYHVIRHHIDELICDLKTHINNPEYFYQIRALDRDISFFSLSSVIRASRIIYLNKTCYNGLFRVNRCGQFNVPFGHNPNPNIVNEPVLRAIHEYLRESDITMLNTDFATAVRTATSGDFVYLDPPYDPVSTTSSFTSYSLDGFNKKEQIRLKHVIDELDQRGCYIMLSNSATDFIFDLYKKYNIRMVGARRKINSKTGKRGKIHELLITNY
jgi:DNA adenine methylase